MIFSIFLDGILYTNFKLHNILFTDEHTIEATFLYPYDCIVSVNDLERDRIRKIFLSTENEEYNEKIWEIKEKFHKDEEILVYIEQFLEDWMNKWHSIRTDIMDQAVFIYTEEFIPPGM